jgi:hypothetical protein
VEFIVDPGRELGITIRGGAEHGLGIYVSKIDPGSVAESNDIKVLIKLLAIVHNYYDYDIISLVIKYWK